MRWIRTTITADLANNETITHALNWRTSPQPDVDQDAQAMLAFATQIKTHWVNFLNNAAPGTGSAPKVHLSGDVKYREVTAAYLEQTVPATITTHPSRKTGHQVKDFTYPRPTYLVPTQFVQFDPNTGGTATGTALPYEVAMCISLKTGLRGPRNRGRLYLGGFTTDAMGGAGNFADIPVNTMLGGFRNFVNSMNVDTGNRLHIVSRAYATSIGVNAVTAGIVPDSQRRRRRSRDESYKTQFDT